MSRSSSSSSSRSDNRKRPLLLAAYTRCSTDDQAHGDFSTNESQRRIVRAHIDQRVAEERAAGREARYVGEFTDDRTGTNLNRPGYKALLAAVERREVNAVAFTFNSRLARGEVFYIAEYELKKAGATIETVQETFGDDASGRLKKKFGILIDGEYCEKVSEHTRTKQQSMVAMGYWTGGYPRFGYRSEPVPGTSPTVLPGGKVKPPPKRLVPFEEEAQVLRQAMQVYVLTRNMGAVLRYLREACPDRRWTMDKVRALLTDDICRGVLRFGPNVNHTAFEAIVGEQLWDAVQTVLQARQEEKEAAGAASVLSSGVDAGAGVRLSIETTDRPIIYHKENRARPLSYYLRGIVFCPHCGNRMTPGSATGRNGAVGYYICIKGGNRSKSDRPCPIQRVNAARLHESALDGIARVGEHPTRLDLLLREAVKALPTPTGLRDELAREYRNRRAAEKKIALFVATIAAGGGAGLASISAAIAEQETVKAAIDARIVAIEKRIAEGTAKRPDCEALRSLWLGFTANWGYLSEEERTELLPLLIEKVTMEEKEKGTMHLILQSPLERFAFQRYLGAGYSRKSKSRITFFPRSRALTSL